MLVYGPEQIQLFLLGALCICMGKQMKLLFLDVDGVLNSHKTGGLYALKRPCLKRLEKIVKETGCEIVLSSTWRKDEYALKRLKRVLQYRGIKIKDVTPVDPKGFRGEEVRLKMIEYMPDKVAILDDDSDFYDYQLKYFFQTDGEYGMTDTIAYRVIQHLNQGEE